MGKKLIIAEKHSVAVSIAEALNAKKEKMRYENDEYVIVWCAGHILQLRDFKEYPEILALANPTTGKTSWNDINIPFVPKKFEYIIPEETKGLVQNVIWNINRNDVDILINAGDNDAEGQVIVDNVLRYSKTNKKILRIFLNNMSKNTITEELAKNRDNKSKECLDLYKSGIARSRIDWIYGMNASIYATVLSGTLIRAGRIKVPIIEHIYNRDMEILNFVPKPYFNVDSRTTIRETEIFLSCPKKYEKDQQKEAEEYAEFLNKHLAEVKEIKKIDKKKEPKLLYKATTFQSYAAKKLKISQKQVENIMQNLYLNNYITYPRTESQHISPGDKDKIKNVISQLNDPRLEFKPDSKLFNESKIIASHSGLMPTEKIPNNLDEISQGIYDIIKARFCANFTKEECIVSETTMKIQIAQETFTKKGEVLKQEGWSVFEPLSLANNLPDLKEGEAFKVDFKAVQKMTTPPSKISLEGLNTYLDNPFKKNEDTSKYDEDISEEDFKNIANGLKIGTPATRTSAIEECLKEGYITYDGKKDAYSIEEKGRLYIENLRTLNIDLFKNKSVKLSYDITRIQKGEFTVEEMIAEAEKDLKDMVENNKKKGIQVKTFEKQKFEKVEVGKYNNIPIYKKKTQKGNLYAADDNSFILFENTKIYGKDFLVKENQVKKLLKEGKFEGELQSKAGNPYTAYIVIDKISDKGYVYLKTDGFAEKAKERTK